MQTIATFRVQDIKSGVLFETERVYKNTDKKSEENKMLRDLDKTRRELLNRYIQHGTKDRKLSVTFESVQSGPEPLEDRMEQVERRKLLGHVKQLDTETLRSIYKIYCK